VANIAVLGLGSWGSALAHHLARNNHTVFAWDRDPSIVAGINTTRKNPRYVSQWEIDSRVLATNDLNILREVSMVVLALPAVAMEHSALLLKNAKSDALIVSGVKGLEAKTIHTPLQYLIEQGFERDRLVTFSGPSFARDLLEGHPVGIVSASTSEAAAEETAKCFYSPTMRVYTSNDTIGVELGGALKNVIAIAAGLSDGLGFGESSRSGIITRGLVEMTKLAKACGAQQETLSGLTGLGDLIMTATSRNSRNWTVGFRLGGGEKLSTILATLGSVAEGVTTTPLMGALAKRYGVTCMIRDGVEEILAEKIAAHEIVGRLINRPIKREFS